MRLKPQHHASLCGADRPKSKTRKNARLGIEVPRRTLPGIGAIQEFVLAGRRIGLFRFLAAHRGEGVESRRQRAVFCGNLGVEIVRLTVSGDL